MSAGGLEKDSQYISDVVFSKVSPTSDQCPVNNQADRTKDKKGETDETPNKLDSVYEMQKPSARKETGQHIYFGDGGGHKEVKININIEKPLSLSNDTKFFDSSLDPE